MGCEQPLEKTNVRVDLEIQDPVGMPVPNAIVEIRPQGASDAVMPFWRGMSGIDGRINQDWEFHQTNRSWILRVDASGYEVYEKKIKQSGETLSGKIELRKLKPPLNR
jgi:hypothetical protein